MTQVIHTTSTRGTTTAHDKMSRPCLDVTEIRFHSEQTCGHSEGKERRGQIETGALKHIHYHI